MQNKQADNCLLVTNLTSVMMNRLSFLVAEICLIAGSARNAYHTKYVGYYTKKDLQSCAALRKGVFAAAAAMIMLSLVSLLLYYWSYAKAYTGGWVKQQNDVGVGMAEYGPDKREYQNSQAWGVLHLFYLVHSPYY